MPSQSNSHYNIIIHSYVHSTEHWLFLVSVQFPADLLFTMSKSGPTPNLIHGNTEYTPMPPEAWAKCWRDAKTIFHLDQRNGYVKYENYPFNIPWYARIDSGNRNEVAGIIWFWLIMVCFRVRSGNTASSGHTCTIFYLSRVTSCHLRSTFLCCFGWLLLNYTGWCWFDDYMN